MDITFETPAGMKPVEVAQTFAAYLLGRFAFEGPDRQPGARQMTKGNDESWMLDGSNDYFLHIDGAHAMIRCRYEYQEAVLQATVALFKANVSLRL